MSAPTAPCRPQPTRASQLDRYRTPVCVFLLGLIVVGGVFWLLRQPRSTIEIVPPARVDVPAADALRDGRLDLNTASAAELEALSGIGPVTARRILEYREQHGGFTSVDELLRAKLLPRSVLERLRDQLTVAPY